VAARGAQDAQHRRARDHGTDPDPGLSATSNRIYLQSQRDGIDFNLAYIPSSFKAPHPEEFDREYMRALFKLGFDLGAAGYRWDKLPPGYAAGVPEMSFATGVSARRLRPEP
jgi:hypothetical protein